MSCSTDRTKDTAHDFEKGETKKINKFWNKLGWEKESAKTRVMGGSGSACGGRCPSPPVSRS